MKVGDMPRRRIGRSITDWNALAAVLAEHPGEAVLIDDFTDTESVMSILTSINRKRGVDALNALGGNVRAQMRNTRATAGRGRRGDVWVTWNPEGSEGETPPSG